VLTINNVDTQIPFIWDIWLPKAEADFKKQIDKWESEDAKRLRRIASGKPRKTDATAAEKPNRRMLPGDEKNFLKLATALKIVMARSVKDSDIPRARELLYDYLTGFLLVGLFSFLSFLS
jgi:hypothetical protein